jgi:hypothetical protein
LVSFSMIRTEKVEELDAITDWSRTPLLVVDENLALYHMGCRIYILAPAVLFTCYARHAVYNRSRIDITGDNRYAKPCRSDRLEFVSSVAFLLKSSLRTSLHGTVAHVQDVTAYNSFQQDGAFFHFCVVCGWGEKGE